MGKIQLKRGLNANLGALTLSSGEPAFTTDTGKLYIGNGVDKVLINPDISEVAKSLNVNGSTDALSGVALVDELPRTTGIYMLNSAVSMPGAGDFIVQAYVRTVGSAETYMYYATGTHMNANGFSLRTFVKSGTGTKGGSASFGDWMELPTTLAMATAISTAIAGVNTTIGNYQLQLNPGVGIIKSTGAGTVAKATEGTDYLGPVAVTGGASTKCKITYDDKGRVTGGANLDAADIPSLTKAKISDFPALGTAAALNSGTGSGNVPVLDGNGKLNTSILPALAITDTYVCANQTAMLTGTGAGTAEGAEVGDVCIRTDLNKSFILKAAGRDTLANWQELLTPTDIVTSVAGKTGAVTLVKGDVGLGLVDNTADANKAVLSATKLATARTINGVSFDGTGNITVNAVDSTAREASLGNPAQNGYVLSSTTGGVRSWVAQPVIPGVASSGSNGLVPASGTPVQNAFLRAQVTSGTVAWAAIAPADVGLGSVNNTADSAKNVLSATKLTTARTINGTSFDGSANISIDMDGGTF